MECPPSSGPFTLDFNNKEEDQGIPVVCIQAISLISCPTSMLLVDFYLLIFFIASGY